MHYDVIILGAGAAGMMCAIEAGKRHQKVLIVEKSNKPGRKILMSGGGRCNFTNLHVHPTHYISQNPHFFKSALSRYTQWDFLEMVQRHRIPFHEKTLGQLFCDNKASDIVEMLLTKMLQHKVTLCLESEMTQLSQTSTGFSLMVNQKKITATSVVVATGGLTVPSMGSSPFAYHIAAQFGLKILPTRPGLVPLTWHAADKERFSLLTGISIKNTTVSVKKNTFKEGLLFTHRGLSGPAILQISSYWQPGEAIKIHLLPDENIIPLLKKEQKASSTLSLKAVLLRWFAQRFLQAFFSESLLNQRVKDMSQTTLSEIEQRLQQWLVKPNGTEGYRTAEVTLGGVDTTELSSKSFEAKKVPGLFFIGEAVDVAGWLGGYNFQWAWSSGWAAGQAV